MSSILNLYVRYNLIRPGVVPNTGIPPRGIPFFKKFSSSLLAIVVLRHALRFAVREDVTVDPVPDVLGSLGVRTLRASELVHLESLLPGLLRGEKDVDFVVADLLGSLAVGEALVVVQLAEPAREKRRPRSGAK